MLCVCEGFTYTKKGLEMTTGRAFEVRNRAWEPPAFVWMNLGTSSA